MICQSISFVTCPCRLRRTMTSLYYGRLNTCPKVVTYKVMGMVLMVCYCYIYLTLWIMFCPACMSGGRCCSVCVSEWEEWQEDGIEQDKSMRCLSKVCTMGVIIRMSGNHGRLFKKEMMDYRCAISARFFGAILLIFIYQYHL